MAINPLDNVWLLLNGSLIFALQVGIAMFYAAYHPGGRRALLSQTVATVLIAAVAFWGIGYVVAFGDSVWGVFGLPNRDIRPFSLQSPQDDVTNYFFFTIQVAAVASMIISGVLGPRWNPIRRTIALVVFNAVLLPLTMHWVWGWGGWLFEMGYNDFAGATVIHTVAAGVLVGASIEASSDKQKVAMYRDPTLTWRGIALIWLGWYGLNVGSTLDASYTDLIGLTALNTTVAGLGGMAGWGLLRLAGQSNNNLHLADGILVGLVGSTASCGFNAPWGMFLTALLSAVVIVGFISRRELNRIQQATLIHGVGAFFGLASVGLFGLEEYTWSTGAGLFSGGDGFMLWMQMMVWFVVMVGGIAAASILATFGLLGVPATDDAPRKRKVQDEV